MGTRGLYGISKNYVDKCSYNHFDSGPNFLGKDIARFCAKHSADDISRFYDTITLVDDEDHPDYGDLERLARMGLDEDVSHDWYDVLRGYQGDLEKLYRVSKTTGDVFMTNDWTFILNSLFCEYAYIINLDDGTLDFFVGFQKEPDIDNPYGIEKNNDGYYPCKCVATFPLNDLYNGNLQVDSVVDVMNIKCRREL